MIFGHWYGQEIFRHVSVTATNIIREATPQTVHTWEVWHKQLCVDGVREINLCVHDKKNTSKERCFWSVVFSSLMMAGIRHRNMSDSHRSPWLCRSVYPTDSRTRTRPNGTWHHTDCSETRCFEHCSMKTVLCWVWIVVITQVTPILDN
jgi:hypothetical protein